MPEAAEVSVAAEQLAHVAVGRVLSSLPVTHPRTARHAPVGALADLVGRPIVGVDRHGKWLLVRLGGVGPALGIHLRMSGQLLVRPPDDRSRDDHVHARLQLGARVDAAPEVRIAPRPPTGGAGVGDDDVEVWFRDPRTFGEVRPVECAPVAADLFDPEVTAESLHRASHRRRVGAKAVLLDQHAAVAGIGSYLADEALHAAGIAPVVASSELAVSAWERILGAARAITLSSTTEGGVTLADEGWVDLWGRPGRYADQLQVHALAACRTCGTVTQTAVVGGRRARWCPRCQGIRRRR